MNVPPPSVTNQPRRLVVPPWPLATITGALLLYGRYDPDDDWDNYNSQWCQIVQFEADGHDEHDELAADRRPVEDREGEELILPMRASDTGFVAEPKEVIA